MPDFAGGSVVWDLDVDDSGLKKGLKSASGSVDDFAKSTSTQMSSVSASISNAFKSAEAGSKLFAGGLLTAGGAIGGLVGLGVKTGAEFETLQTALETVTGSSELASKALEDIKQVAKESPFFEVSTLAQFTQLMAAAGQEIDQALETGVLFGDVAAAFGKGNAEVTRLGNTLSQVIGKGKADTVDFKELVNSGWVSVRKDTAEAIGVSIDQFEELVSAGEIGYEDIAKAGQKFAGASEAQSKNLSSLWSRFGETVSTSLSDITINTGIFDQLKIGLEGVIIAIENIDINKISSFIETLSENIPIITGFIAGGLAPAFAALVTSIGAALVPLLPFIAAGTALGLLVQTVVERMGGWENVMSKLNEVFSVFGSVYESFVQPAVNELKEVVASELVPALQNLWTQVSPVLTPALQLMAGVIGGTVLVGLRLFVEVLKFTAQAIADGINKVNSMIEVFKSLGSAVMNGMTDISNSITGEWTGVLDFLKGIGGQIVDAMVSPFRSARDDIKNIAASIKESTNRISPFHRESPSLVDNVNAGVDDIITKYASLGQIEPPSVAGFGEGFTQAPQTSGFIQPQQAQPDTVPTNGVSGGQTVNVYVDKIGDQQDITALGREFAFRSGLEPNVANATNIEAERIK